MRTGHQDVNVGSLQSDGNRLKSTLFNREVGGAGVETQKNVLGEVGGWGRVPFNETYATTTVYATPLMTSHMLAKSQELRAYCRLTKTGAGPSDARIAAAASHFTGVFLACAWCLELSHTLKDPHWIRRRRDHDHTVSCSSAPQ